MLLQNSFHPVHKVFVQNLIAIFCAIIDIKTYFVLNLMALHRIFMSSLILSSVSHLKVEITLILKPLKFETLVCVTLLLSYFSTHQCKVTNNLRCRIKFKYSEKATKIWKIYQLYDLDIRLAKFRFSEKAK